MRSSSIEIGQERGNGKYTGIHFHALKRGKTMRGPIVILLSALLLLNALPLITGGLPEAGSTRTGGRTLFVSETGSTWSSVNRAIENATAGDTIMIAPGNYTDGMMLLKDGIDIVGNESQGDVNIMFPYSEAVVGISGDHINVSGIRIVGVGSHINGLMMSFCHNVTLRNLTIDTTVSDGMYIRNCEDIAFDGLTIRSGERGCMEIRDVSRLYVEDFDLNSSGSWNAVKISHGCSGLLFANGTVSMEGPDAIVFDMMDEVSMVLDGVSCSYSEGLVRMERGEVVCFDTFFDPDDINITSADVNDTLRAYVRRDIYVTGESRSGTMVPLKGVELDVESTEGAVYRTPHFGGTDPVSDDKGRFRGPVVLPIVNFTGGSHPPTFNQVFLRAHLDSDRNGDMNITLFDLNSTEPVLLEFRDIHHTNGTIKGRISYSGGPMDGLLAANASVSLAALETSFDTNVSLLPPASEMILANTTTDDTGHFLFSNVDFAHDLTLIVHPRNEVPWGGNMSGYTGARISFDHNMVKDVNGSSDGYSIYVISPGADYPDTVLDPELDYYEYIPPTNGTISGVVIYDGGPLDSEFANNTTVRLYNLTGDMVSETTTDRGGNFSFKGVPFGDGYEIRAYPREALRGVINNSTGYLPWDGSAFNLTGDLSYNISLKYYEHHENLRKHPSVMILDTDNEPVEGVEVTLFVEGERYTSVTDGMGVAEFEQIEGLAFPEGSSFRAEKEGYETIEWNIGEGIPKMRKEAERPDDTFLVLFLVGVVILILVLAVFLMSRKRPTRAPREE